MNHVKFWESQDLILIDVWTQTLKIAPMLLRYLTVLNNAMSSFWTFDFQSPWLIYFYIFFILLLQDKVQFSSKKFYGFSKPFVIFTRNHYQKSQKFRTWEFIYAKGESIEILVNTVGISLKISVKGNPVFIH